MGRSNLNQCAFVSNSSIIHPASLPYCHDSLRSFSRPLNPLLFPHVSSQIFLLPLFSSTSLPPSPAVPTACLDVIPCPNNLPLPFFFFFLPRFLHFSLGRHAYVRVWFTLFIILESSPWGLRLSSL